MSFGLFGSSNSHGTIRTFKLSTAGIVGRLSVSHSFRNASFTSVFMVSPVSVLLPPFLISARADSQMQSLSGKGLQQHYEQ